MRMKKPYIASLDQVRISREDEYGIIEYLEPNVSATHLRIGPNVQTMTDQQILDEHNRILRIQEQSGVAYEHAAIEIPPGHPQIKYFEPGDQWTPRGDVLRCIISDEGPDGEAVIYIDDKDLSLYDFGRLLTTHAGWGMRIVFVSDDRMEEQPDIKVQDPQDHEGYGT